jgi:elongation factor Ts
LDAISKTLSIFPERRKKIMKDLIVKLRGETGAGLLEVKKALDNTGGNYEAAKASLVAAGAIKAGSKSERETNEGLIVSYIHPTGKVGAFLSLSCETDFVAKNDIFKKLAGDIALHICASDATDIASLLAEGFIKDESGTVDSLISQAIVKLGENIVIKQFIKFEI